MLTHTEGQMTNYRINLYQNTGETQFQWESESLEEITKLWNQEKSQQDEFTEFDEELLLYKGEELIDSYIIPESQKGN